MSDDPPCSHPGEQPRARFFMPIDFEVIAEFQTKANAV
jgi:hypothetical protein